MSGTIGATGISFYTSLPAGYGKAGTASSKAAAGPADIVDIRVPLPAGRFTIKAGDSVSVRELFGSPEADLMRVALRGEGGGRLVLRGADVTERTDFEPLEFNELQYVAGVGGSAQELVAVARTGTRNAEGRLTKIVDSEPVQVTAAVTGTRSLSVMPALRTPAGGADGGFVRVAQDAAVFAGSATRKAPALTNVGDVALKAGDALALHDLFASTGTPQPALYRVALRQEADGGARLLLNGKDASGRTDFTPEEFINLQFVAGAEGNRAELLVVARAGTKGADGSWTAIADSPATAITASVTGARSANAAPALRTALAPGDADAAFLRLAREAAIFTGSAARPAPEVKAGGDLTVKAGDGLSLRDLFPASGKVEAAQYRVALRDDPQGPAGGRLLLNGADVTARTDFTPIEFLSLQYVAGPKGGVQDILVVARAGQADGKGGLTALADSAPATLRAAVTGTRSLNTAEALRTATIPGAADADFMRVASEAAIFAPRGGAAAPELDTVGHFTAAAGDTLALRDLFASPDVKGVTVDGFRVAMRDEDVASGARLLLNGQDVSRRVDFTPAEFNTLQFVAGAQGSATDLLVVARGTDAKGTKVDSRAVQVTARVTGERSINAMEAQRGVADAYARIAADAAVFAPMGSQVAPRLRAAGDFTAAAGDRFSMNTLFDTAGGVFEAGMTYRVALREDGGGAATARLLLNGTEVTGRTEFTGAEFSALVFEAGAAGSAQDLLVVARRKEGDLIIDSPALEITARATGTRSVNALSALRGESLRTGFDRLVQDAAIYNTSGARTLSSIAAVAAPDLAPAALAASVGAYKASGGAAANALDLSALFRGGGTPALSELVTLLGGGAVGGVRSSGVDMAKLTALALSIKA